MQSVYIPSYFPKGTVSLLIPAIEMYQYLSIPRKDFTSTFLFPKGYCNCISAFLFPEKKLYKYTFKYLERKYYQYPERKLYHDLKIRRKKTVKIPSYNKKGHFCINTFLFPERKLYQYLPIPRKETVSILDR